MSISQYIPLFFFLDSLISLSDGPGILVSPTLVWEVILISLELVSSLSIGTTVIGWSVRLRMVRRSFSEQRALLLRDSSATKEQLGLSMCSAGSFSSVSSLGLSSSLSLDASENSSSSDIKEIFPRLAGRTG